MKLSPRLWRKTARFGNRLALSSGRSASVFTLEWITSDISAKGQTKKTSRSARNLSELYDMSRTANEMPQVVVTEARIVGVVVARVTGWRTFTRNSCVP
jgi:hypothetical protein